MIILSHISQYILFSCKSNGYADAPDTALDIIILHPIIDSFIIYGHLSGITWL